MGERRIQFTVHEGNKRGLDIVSVDPFVISNLGEQFSIFPKTAKYCFAAYTNKSAPES